MQLPLSRFAPRRSSGGGEGGGLLLRGEGAFVRGGVGADVGEAERVFHARSLTGFARCPAADFFELGHVIVEQIVHRNRREDKFAGDYFAVACARDRGGRRQRGGGVRLRVVVRHKVPLNGAQLNRKKDGGLQASATQTYVD